MTLEILIPIWIYLNSLPKIQELYWISREFYSFESQITPEEIETTKRHLKMKSLISQITFDLFLNRIQIANDKISQLEKFKEAQSYTLYFKAVVESKKGNFLKATIMLKESLKMNPDFDPAWNLLGYIQSNAGKYKQAILSFKKAISLEPYQPLYHYNIARVYWLMGKRELALESINKTISLRDNLAEAYFLKGLLFETSDPEKALTNFQYALERNLNTDEFYLRFLQLAYKNQKAKYVVQLLEKIQNTKHPKLLILKFKIHIDNGEWNQAYFTWIQILSNNIFSRYNINSKTKNQLIEKAKILACTHKLQFEEFLQKEKKLLSKESIALIKTIIETPCSQPIDAKDPILNPAL